MNTTLVSLQEYLDTAYSPDREYVDGVVVERHVGERPHSTVQSNLNFFLRLRYPQIRVFPEQRIQTGSNRARIPDVCVTLIDPGVDVFAAPPLICIEILSRRDEASDLLEKLDEYARMGVPNIWVIDPRRKKAFTFRGALDEVRGQALTSQDPEISIPLDEVFQGL
jgi:Uma2 family endonuclease